jgi:putative colanic acid biosynthesis UDP-glucose lipid carrier transferase
VAHNEHYRKLIKGFLQRRKVRSGLTGWAQVNGLDYLRNWSPRRDVYIVAKTVWIVLTGEHAN